MKWILAKTEIEWRRVLRVSILSPIGYILGFIPVIIAVALTRGIDGPTGSLSESGAITFFILMTALLIGIPIVLGQIFFTKHKVLQSIVALILAIAILFIGIWFFVWFVNHIIIR